MSVTLIEMASIFTLADAVSRLGSDNSRVFLEVFKGFDYKEDAPLKDYLDFVCHEPPEWMRGFPSKWKSESQFARVRASFHKLLKNTDVQNALGIDYANRVHDVIWGVFKTHMEPIIVERIGKSKESITNSIRVDPPLSVDTMSIAESIHSLKKKRVLIPSDNNTRYNILESAFRTLVSGDGDETARLRSAILILLDHNSE